MLILSHYHDSNNIFVLSEKIRVISNNKTKTPSLISCQVKRLCLDWFFTIISLKITINMQFNYETYLF